MKKAMHRGFTLIEIMTAVAIFSIVMTISIGSILGVFDANRKAEALRSVMDNLNLAVESMSREMRFGSVYHCGGAPFDTRAFCSSGQDTMAFLANDGRRIVYRQNGTTIEKSTNGGASFVPVTAQEINISSLVFYVLGTNTLSEGDTQQPRVLIKIKGTAGTKAVAKTDFILQTLVSQRQLDNQ